MGTLQRSKRMPGSCLHPAHSSRLEEILLPAVSSCGSFKNRVKKKHPSVFPSQEMASSKASTNSRRLLLCAAAIREVFITLRSLPVWHRGVCPGQAGEGAFRMKAQNPLAHGSSLPPQGAAREETRTRNSLDHTREQDGWREQSCAPPPDHCTSSPALLQQHRLLPIPGQERDKIDQTGSMQKYQTSPMLRAQDSQARLRHSPSH